MLNHLFTTPLLHETTALTPAQLDEIRTFLLDLRAGDPGETRSNRGGWHSPGNLFAPEHQQFPALTGTVTSALFAYIRDAFGYRGEIQLGLTGWAVINRPGDFNTIHNHAANLLSGALYIEIPDGMEGGGIHFQDPRLNLNAHGTEAMRRINLQPPWHGASVGIQPAAGEILIFPSWLNHWVEPYQSRESEALRIVVSFNATVT